MRSCIRPTRRPFSISTLRCVGVPSSSMVSEPRRSAKVPSSTTVTPGEAIISPISLVNIEVFLRWKSPSSPWPTASCHSTPDQPEPEHDRHLAGRRRRPIRRLTSAWRIASSASRCQYSGLKMSP